MGDNEIRPKDRIRAAFEHRELDRIPVSEQSVASDVASEILGREAFTGTTYLHYQEAAAWMAGEQAHCEFEERLDEDIVALARELGFDMLHQPWRVTGRPTGQLDEYTFLYGSLEGDYAVRRFDPEARTFGVVEQGGPSRPPDDPDELEPLVRSLEEQAARCEVADPRDAYPWHAEMLERYGDEFEITGQGGLSIPLQPAWLMACRLRPDLVCRYLDAQLESLSKRLEAQARLGLKVVWAGGDFADNNGPCYGPDVFRRIVVPRVRRLTAKCHELGQRYAFCTDGNLWPVEKEFFVDCNIDGYGEIDYDAGMDLDRLKPLYGDRITFWGNVPCGSVLHKGSVEDVVTFTKHVIDVAAPGGGFILGSSNSIVPGTPARNVVAMFETARQYGRY